MSTIPPSGMRPVAVPAPRSAEIQKPESILTSNPDSDFNQTFINVINAIESKGDPKDRNGLVDKNEVQKFVEDLETNYSFVLPSVASLATSLLKHFDQVDEMIVKDGAIGVNDSANLKKVIEESTPTPPSKENPLDAARIRNTERMRALIDEVESQGNPCERNGLIDKNEMQNFADSLQKDPSRYDEIFVSFALDVNKYFDEGDALGIKDGAIGELDGDNFLRVISNHQKAPPPLGTEQPSL